MNKRFFINGDYVSDAEASIHVSDLGLQRGYGVFDFLRVVEGKPLFVQEHLLRFAYSASRMHLELPYSAEELHQVILQLAELSGETTCGVKLTLTGGYSEDGYLPGRPNLIIGLHELPKASTQSGLHLITYEHQRQLPDVKTTDYLMAVWLQPLLRERGANDILYHQNNRISECPRANFFIVNEQGVIQTPSRNVLAGITRSRVLRLAREIYQVEEKDLEINEIFSAREAFITSTTKGVFPVLSVDGKQLPGGEITAELQHLLMQDQKIDLQTVAPSKILP